MKKRHTFLLLLPLLLILLSCNKDDDKPADPVDQLPPITQTGAGTFGALVDGKPFIGNNPYFNCYYQFVDGGYYFGIQGLYELGSLTAITIGVYDKSLSENEIINLLEAELGNAWGGGGYKGSGTIHTGQDYTGELKINKLDFTNNIVSGTFWFDLKHPVTGERVKIREGRFDTRFTQ